MVTRTRCPAWVYKMQDDTAGMDGVLKESEPMCESGTMPASIVLREWGKGEFVTHMKIYPIDKFSRSSGKPNYAYGHYIRDREKAIADYKKRCEDYEVQG